MLCSMDRSGWIRRHQRGRLLAVVMLSLGIAACGTSAPGHRPSETGAAASHATTAVPTPTTSLSTKPTPVTTPTPTASSTVGADWSTVSVVSDGLTISLRHPSSIIAVACPSQYGFITVGPSTCSMDQQGNIDFLCEQPSSQNAEPTPGANGPYTATTQPYTVDGITGVRALYQSSAFGSYVTYWFDVQGRSCSFEAMGGGIVSVSDELAPTLTFS